AYSDTTMITIDARQDTVSGRLLVGNDQANVIRAGSGGASMWAGNGSGDDWNHLYGGNGSDTFIMGSDGGKTAAYDVGDEDVVVLHDLNISDIVAAGKDTGNSGDVIILTPANRNHLNIWYDADNTTITTVEFANGERRTFDHINGSWLDLFVDSDSTLTSGLITLGSTVYITPSFVGDIALGGTDWNGNAVEGFSDSAMRTVDARQDTVSGRLLAGNSNRNEIYAGSGGASLWGGPGAINWLFGGDGADTFIAGKDEGDAIIWYCSDDDLVVLHNINFSDIANVELYDGSSSSRISITTSGGNIIYVWYERATTNTTTLRFADGEQRTYDHATGSWLDLFVDESGVFTTNNAVYIVPSFEGNIALGGVDPNGSSIDAWSDTSLVSVDARQDTINGRLLAGNYLSNRIYAGSGGASMWGGTRGDDYLYGGAGADTFIAGAGEGNTSIQNCNDEDIVVLHNITPDDIANVNATSTVLSIQTTDETNIVLTFSTDTTLTSIRYADGDTRTWDHINGQVRDLFIVRDDMPDGLGKFGDTVVVESAYAGDIWLGGVNLDGNSVVGWSSTLVGNIDASDDTVGNRMLAGDDNDNVIYSGSNGASLWGGDGGSDTLIGGAGVDTFIVTGSGEGVLISDCAVEDIIVLHNINATDVESTFLYNSNVRMTLNDGTVITVVGSAVESDASLTTTFRFANGDVFAFDHASEGWQAVSTQSGSTYPPAGFLKLGSTVYISSAFNGDVALGGVDWNGSTVDAFSDTDILYINARQDTVGGRMLVGSSGVNYIYAGSGGSSLWGGGASNYDYLYGGDGADTFIAGKSEGSLWINNVGDFDARNALGFLLIGRYH
ncbi:MAG: hypothetical protein IJU71_06200, partial [Selenomonadaceae bacterium]|nr:hypothetical protein [Selenomonadaceae bacterium]